MSADSQNSKKPPAGENSDVQLSKLVTEKALQSLDKPPEVVAWTLADFKEEVAPKTQKDTEDQQRQVEAEVEARLQKEREALKKQTFDQAYQEGYEKGFALGKEEGLEVGKSEAYTEARALIFAKLQNLESILEELQSPYDKLEAHLLSELTQFAVNLAQKVILFKIEETPEWLLKTVEQTVKGLPETANKVPVEVFLSAEDLKFLQSLPEFSQEPYCDWQLKVDSSLPAGSCQVKQGFSSIHNDWQSRFEQVKKQVLSQHSMPQESTHVTPEESQAEASSVESAPPTEHGDHVSEN